MANLDPRGMYGQLNIAKYKLWALLFQKKIFFSHYKSMEAIILWGVTSFDPRGLIGRIYAENH